MKIDDNAQSGKGKNAQSVACFVSPWLLYAAWCSTRDVKEVTALTLLVWLWWLEERQRRPFDAWDQALYRIEDFATGMSVTEKVVRDEIRRLLRVGLLVGEVPQRLPFKCFRAKLPQSYAELGGRLESWEEGMALAEAENLPLGPLKRLVPIQRSMIRFLGRESKRNSSRIAFALCYSMRCLFYNPDREERFQSTGSVKACEMARLFGVSERSVERQREFFDRIGWLSRLSRPAWHEQAFGGSVELNLDWIGANGEELCTRTAGAELSGRGAELSGGGAELSGQRRRVVGSNIKQEPPTEVQEQQHKNLGAIRSAWREEEIPEQSVVASLKDSGSEDLAFGNRRSAMRSSDSAESKGAGVVVDLESCLLYTSPSPRDPE